MEILEIQSSHSLITTMPANRPDGAHVYKINCKQFTSAFKSWQKDSVAQARPLAVMTLGFERIWITREEAEQVAAAIQSTSSPIAVG